MSERVLVNIAGKTLEHWTRIGLTFGFDAISVYDLEAPFDPDVQEQRDAFRPFSFHEVTITVENDVVLLGMQTETNPQLTPEGRTVALGGYSKPGVLNDCTPPEDSLPLEFRKATLREIAEELIAPFGIELDYLAPVGEPFDRVKVDPTKKVLASITELAKQRGVVSSSSPTGELRMWVTETLDEPVANLREGEAPLRGVTPSISSGEVYSQLTGLRAVRVRAKSSVSFTVFPEITAGGVFRPYTMKVEQGDDAKVATTGTASRMAAGAASYTAEVETWRTPAGALWQPNTTVRLWAPGAMIYQPFDFFVRNVKLNQESDDESASLDLTLPGSFATDAKVRGTPWSD